ncbi:MAG: TldD/PmbA family protein [Candidatus Micrarchaeota archaeon]
MIDKIKKLIDSCPADYVDARIDSGPFTSIIVKDGKVENVISASAWGLGVRVLVNGSWGFASANRRGKVGEIFEKAVRLAKLTKGKSRLSDEKPVRAKTKTKFKINPRDVNVEEKIKLVLGAEREMRADARIKNTALSYSDAAGKHVFLSSEGAEIFQKRVFTFLGMSAIAKEGAVLQRASESMGARAGYEILRRSGEKAASAREKAIQALGARLPPKGKFTVIIDGRLAGVLAHEAVGHACEGDALMANNSILRGKLGARIASEQITICDDATAPRAFGSYDYDDEGVRASKKIMVERGVLRGFLHSRESGAEFGARSTGNARASGYSDAPIIRMSNTYIERGTWENEELFEIKNGIYAKGMRGGSVMPKTGEYVFAAEEGCLIEDGELAAPLRDILLSGEILKTLKSVEAVARDSSDFHPGMCGKMDQSINVGDRGPHIRIRNVLIGGR